MATRKRGLWPPPVYECHTADGTVIRLSFWSPEGKPVDIAAGRRAADEILLTDQNGKPQWDRSRGYWKCTLPRRDTVCDYLPAILPAARRYGKMRRVDHGAIVRRFVEHDTLPGGRVEDTGEPAAERAAPKRAGERAAKRAAQIPAPDPAHTFRDVNAELLTALANIAGKGAQGGSEAKALAKMARAALIKCGLVKSEGANANTAQQGRAA